MDAARELFEQIVKGGNDLIQEMVNNKWQESLILDFKCAKDNKAPMADEDKRSLAKEMSAFANSEGGVIIWGIYAKSLSPADPDAAQNLRPIQNLELFLSNLQQFTPQMIAPGIIGVLHYPIYEDSENTRGYAITYVPKSQGEPHMARGKDQHRFYYRSGSSSLIMEPFMLADRYSRRPQPKLELTWEITWDGSADGYLIGLLMSIRNTGIGIALYPALAVYGCAFFGLNLHTIGESGQFGLSMRLTLPDEPKRIFVGGVNDVIHPGTELLVARLRGVTRAKELHDIPIDTLLKYELYCEGFSHTGEVLIPIRGKFERLVLGQVNRFQQR